MAFSAIVALTIILGIISYNNANRVGTDFTFLVEHDLNVLQNAQHLQKLVVDAETGQRGFIITGDNNFLQPYYSGVSQFEALIQVEKNLISDNPSQVQKLEKIEELFEAWQTKAAIPEIKLAREVHQVTINVNDLENLLAKETGKAILNEIRLNLDNLARNLAGAKNFEASTISIQIGKDVVDRETGQRGFLITGKENFLEPYHAGNERLGNDIEKLRTMLAGDQENLQILDRIEFLADEWIEKAALPEIDARRQVNENPSIVDISALLQSGTGKGILDNIRAEFAEFIQIENELKDKRFETASTIESDTKNYVIVIIMTSSIFAGMMGLLMHRSIFSPLRNLRDMTDEISKGNYDVKAKATNRDEIGELALQIDKIWKSIKKSEEKLKAQTKELATANKLLKQVDRQKDEFLAVVSHELRTPLVPIRGNCEVLLDEDNPEQLSDNQRELIKSVSSNSDRLSKLIHKILLTQRIGLGKYKYTMEDLSAKKLIDKIFQSYSPIMEKKQIKFENLTKNDLVVSCDKRSFDEILQSLLNNAMNFVPEKNAKIEVDAKADGDSVVFFVKDNGEGIPLEKQDKLFKKFYQVDSSLGRKHEGTGLGLAICKDLVQGMGGKIWVESEGEGKGATFYFSLKKGDKK